jgi:hypothetical protein
VSAVSKDPKKEDDSKVFDVAKPGETAAEPTARPVIVGRSSILKQDPMVAGGDDDAGVQEKSSVSSLSTKSKINIKPLSQNESTEDEGKITVSTEANKKPEGIEIGSPAKDEKAAGDNEEVTAKPKAPSEQKSAEEPAQKAEEDKDEKKEEPASDTTGTGAVDALAGEANAKKESDKEAEESLKKAAEIEGIIESKEYYVPIKETISRRSGRLLSIFLLLCLLAVVGLNFAVDAQLVDVGISPLTDLL